MNGVFTTLPNADKSKLALEMANGLTTESGKEIRYELLYTFTNGFEDFVEVFEQRLAEHGGLLAGRFELLLESLNGKSAWWEKILESFSFYEGTHHVWLDRSEEHTSELQSRPHLVCRLLLEKKKKLIRPNL